MNETELKHHCKLDEKNVRRFRVQSSRHELETERKSFIDSLDVLPYGDEFVNTLVQEELGRYT